MTTTPSGAIVHWPSIDPITILQEADDVSTPSDSLSPLPFQEGRELNVTSGDEQLGLNNPDRHVFVSIHGESDEEAVSSDDPSMDGETEDARQLRIKLNRSRAFRHRHLRARNLNREFDE